MSDSEDSTVTYTEESSLFEDLSDIGSPGVDRLPMMLEDPYVEATLQASPSPNYVPGPEYPPSPVYVPYVLKPVYPEFMPPGDEVFPEEEQPLPAAVSPTTDSPGYIANSNPEEDEEDPEEDPTDYPADGRDDDDDDESSDDDKNDDDDVEEERRMGNSSETLPSGAHHFYLYHDPTPAPPLPFFPFTVSLERWFRGYVKASEEAVTPQALQATDTMAMNESRDDDFVMIVRQDTNEIYGRLDDAQDDRSLVQLMASSDSAHSEVRALRTTILAQQTEIEDLQAADRKRQTQLTEALTLLRTLQTQMAVL
ncbi:hypothetical protein Tco_0968635 [Tanacetum coccineum]